MVNRDHILRVLTDAAGEADQPWPPSPGKPVALDLFMENVSLIHCELPALTRRVVSRQLLDRGIAAEGLQQSNVPLSGFLCATPNVALAFVNKDEILTRRRFSAAHELGHFLLHFRQQYTTEETYLKADNLEEFHEGEATGVVLDQIEREANQFAAELLMPEEILRQRVAELSQSYRLNETFLKSILASELLVSREAMLWRLRNLHLIPAITGGV